MSTISYFPKIKSFLNREYCVSINIEKLGNIMENLFDDKFNIKDNDKLTVLDNTFEMIFGINFTNILQIIKEEEINESTKNITHDKSHNILIKNLNGKIEEKDKEISILKETIEDLRSNYWNLKQSSLVLTK